VFIINYKKSYQSVYYLKLNINQNSNQKISKKNLYRKITTLISKEMHTSLQKKILNVLIDYYIRKKLKPKM